MLYIISHLAAQNVLEDALNGISTHDPIILSQDGVYLYSWLTHRYPALSVRAVTSDILTRGLAIPAEHQITMDDWAQLSSMHYPWITLA